MPLGVIGLNKKVVVQLDNSISELIDKSVLTDNELDHGGMEVGNESEMSVRSICVNY